MEEKNKLYADGDYYFEFIETAAPEEPMVEEPEYTDDADNFDDYEDDYQEDDEYFDDWDDEDVEEEECKWHHVEEEEEE